MRPGRRQARGQDALRLLLPRRRAHQSQNDVLHRQSDVRGAARGGARPRGAPDVIEIRRNVAELRATLRTSRRHVFEPAQAGVADATTVEVRDAADLDADVAAAAAVVADDRTMTHAANTKPARPGRRSSNRASATRKKFVPSAGVIEGI